MQELTYGVLGKLITEELKGLTTPMGLVRRRGANTQNFIPDKEQTVFTKFYKVHQEDWYKEHSHINIEENLLEITSNLYVGGATHGYWRRWCALTAFGYYLKNDVFNAAIHAMIAGEWAFVERLPAKALSPSIKALSYLVPWILVGGSVTYQPEEPEEYDSSDQPWLQLLTSIPTHAHKITETALAELADFWLMEDEGDYFNLHVGQYPEFETPICAVAALARKCNFRPKDLSTNQYNFLEPGLAEQEPEPLYPFRFTLSDGDTSFGYLKLPT